jgi:hypothetical protein
MPFFLIGMFLKPLKALFNSMHNYFVEIALFVLSIVLVALCGYYNGYVWMYLNGIGNNYALFILGGVAGSCMLYVLSLWLSRLPYRRMVTTLAMGTMPIIGLHIIIVRRLSELPDRLWVDDLFFSLMIMLFFIPVVQLLDCFFPLLLGKKK